MDNGATTYKWTAKADGLHWGYCDVVFTLAIIETETGTQIRFVDETTDVAVSVFTTADQFLLTFDDCHDFVKTVDEAIYWAARKIMKKAGYLY